MSLSPWSPFWAIFSTLLSTSCASFSFCSPVSAFGVSQRTPPAYRWASSASVSPHRHPACLHALPASKTTLLSLTWRPFYPPSSSRWHLGREWQWVPLFGTASLSSSCLIVYGWNLPLAQGLRPRGHCPEGLPRCPVGLPSSATLLPFEKEGLASEDATSVYPPRMTGNTGLMERK